MEFAKGQITSYKPAFSIIFFLCSDVKVLCRKVTYEKYTDIVNEK